MRKSIIILLFMAVFISSCKESTEKSSDPDADFINDSNDKEFSDEFENDVEYPDEISDEYPDEVDDADEPQIIQTGGIVIFDNSRFSFDRPEKHHTILGQGGFF